VKVGVIAIDGTKVHANASHHSNVDYEQLAREILKEAAKVDAEEDELYGDARGDELPEQLRTSEGRRAALRDAKRKLDQDRAEQQNGSATTEAGDGAEAPGVKVELDSELIVARVQGRDGWLLEARRQLDEHRRREARPIPRSRAERLLEQSDGCGKTLRSSAKRTMPMTLPGDRARQARPTAQSPAEAIRAARGAGGKINTTDLDSRNVKTPRSYTQGYNARRS